MNAVAQQDVRGGMWSQARGPRSSGRHLHVVPTAVVDQADPRGGVVLARRRFAAGAVVLLVALGALLAGRAMAAGESAQVARVSVSAGDTLSAIAAREMPGVRTSDAVLAIEQANHLVSSQVDAGQVLVIPHP